MSQTSNTAPRSDRLDRRLAVAIAVLAAVGVALASYLTYVHYAGIKPICATSGCETVQTSAYSKLGGIPVAVLGLASYVAILVALRLPGDARRFVPWTVAFVGCAFSVYLTYREIFTIKAICHWCVASAVLMTLLAILTTIRLTRTDPEPEPLRQRVGEGPALGLTGPSPGEERGHPDLDYRAATDPASPPARRARTR